MSNAPFPIDARLSAITIAYRNRALIADGVLPRVPVPKKEFKFLKHTLAEGFTVPDTRVGRRGAPNEVTFSATEVAGSVQDYGLDDPVPQDDIDGAPETYDPLGRAVEGTTDLILLDREVRTSELVFALGTYPSSQRTTLAGNDQWSEFGTSDPIGDIMLALDTQVMRPNIAVFGRATMSVLQRHPEINKAVHGTSGDAGIARREAIRDLFELEELFVGESFLNTAKPGQAATMARVWGKHAAFLHRDLLADTRRGTTFGFTAQFGQRISGAMPDAKIGLRGGQRVRVGESVRETISASDLGYFIQNATA